MTNNENNSLKLAVPTGRMRINVARLMSEAGIHVEETARDYRPTINFPSTEVKMLKPQSIACMVANGSRDFGFTGRDWVEELGVEVIELLDTKLDSVRVVAAMPESLTENGLIDRSQRLRVASEYENLTRRWIAGKELDASFIRSYGATEVYPPEDADLIVDNTSTGSTLRANDLTIVDTLLESSTLLIANSKTLEDPQKRGQLESFALLLTSVLSARERALVELNVSAEALDAICRILPALRAPTVARLCGEEGFAVKSAVPRSALVTLIPELLQAGGSDVVVTRIEQIC